MEAQIRERLQQIWGYENFRPPQAEVIETLLAGKDALVVLPTGAGKSLCFQLPALIQLGLTIVVSPLIALMENQVQQLQKLGLPGALLHSELSRHQRQQTLHAIQQQKLTLLYLSPETLLSHAVWQILSLPDIKITGLILDEAHCLTQWGTSFRPVYRRLGAVRRSLLKNKPSKTQMAIAAFTATADPQSQQAIIQTLELQNPDIFLVNPYRPNLRLKIQTAWTPRSRQQQTLKFIQAHQQQSGLIYVRSRQETQTLTQWFQALNYRVAAYHGGLPTPKRRGIEQDWLTGEIQFVICTSAFGMGIDKSDVRWIVHFHSPELLTEYVQEVGRSGRNGQIADALTLISEPSGWLDPTDRQRHRFFSRQLAKQFHQAQQLIAQLPLQGSISSIKEHFPQGETTLSILHSLGLIVWIDPFHYRQCSASKVSNSLAASSHQSAQQQMQQYLHTKQCRWQYLLQAFGFQQPVENFQCGKCDNCQNIVI